MDFKKIKYSEKKGVQIEYMDNNNVYTVQSVEKPDPELYNSLQALNSTVVEVCELPSQYLERIETTGVALSTSEDNRGVTIIATMELRNMDKRKLNLITPHFPFTDTKVAPLVKAIEEQAQAFLDGRREQVDLFEEIGVVK